MKRRLLQLCFALGMLLTLAVCGLWIRGYWARDAISVAHVSIEGDRRVWHHVTASGGINQSWIAWTRGDESESAVLSKARLTGFYRPRGTHWELVTGPPYKRTDAISKRGWGWGGFGFEHFTLSAGWQRQIWVPLSFLACLCALTTGLVGWGLRVQCVRQRRLTEKLCPTCGYDLRGAEHERCPECGGSVNAPAARV
ncbi:MAG TPA: hypothetical protein VGR35_19300 [Tepidisphaeraceae bacterium]|nr:hypothetical protein [Tepidisphaeraceae bacterium]